MCDPVLVNSPLILSGEDRFHRDNSSTENSSQDDNIIHPSSKHNQVGTVMLFGVPIVSLIMDGKERLCLAQISSTLLKEFSYNEIHNRRVALGITCVQCTPVQLEILRRAGAMPVTSRRCGMITSREAERLCQSFLGDHAPPQLPDNFAFEVYHECAWGCRGAFIPSRYNSSRAKCIRCSFCQLFFSPNKFVFHSHRLPDSRYVQPDAANFNSWRRHVTLCGAPNEEIVHAWEDVKAMFNGGTRKRLMSTSTSSSSSTPTTTDEKRSKISLSTPRSSHHPSSPIISAPATTTAIWNPAIGGIHPPITPYPSPLATFPWFRRPLLFNPFAPPKLFGEASAFKPVMGGQGPSSLFNYWLGSLGTTSAGTMPPKNMPEDLSCSPLCRSKEEDEEVDIESTEEVFPFKGKRKIIQILNDTQDVSKSDSSFWEATGEDKKLRVK